MNTEPEWVKLSEAVDAEPFDLEAVCSAIRELLQSTSPRTELHANLEYLLHFYEELAQENT